MQWAIVVVSHDPIRRSLTPQVLMCPEHEMEKVNMYCEVCRRPVCHLCKLGGSHANHRVTSMSSAYKILKVRPVKYPSSRHLSVLAQKNCIFYVS